MSKSDQEEVQDERKRVGQTEKLRGKNDSNPSVIFLKAIKAMKAKLKARTITISAMKEKIDIETDDPVIYDAGDSFGGRK